MSGGATSPRVVASTLADLGPMDVHALYKLRVDVFVAEQDCPDAEIDEVDDDPGTTHLLAWMPAADDGGREVLAATLRVFGSGVHGGVMHLGRVCTHPDWRGQGLAGQLIRQGLARCGDAPVEIGAQAHLEQWYEGFGFERCGEEYLDERIPHVPMRRDGPAATVGAAS